MTLTDSYMACNSFIVYTLGCISLSESEGAYRSLEGVLVIGVCNRCDILTVNFELPYHYHL